MLADHILRSIADASDDTEFYTPMPNGYRPGRTRYVVLFGTVMSGLGKGIFSSSLARVIKDKGLAVAPIKLEGYLNLDSGTLNPFRHGEVFVLDDGMECDMDLGTYERMLDQDLARENFATNGQIFHRVLEKERKGGYLGRDVQMIPHVTGEVKAMLRELAVASAADVVFVEIGGTVGDVENAHYIEAMRELAFEEGPNSCCFVALTYILEPSTLSEQKSKAAQLGIRRLLGMGVQPHLIACRAENPVTRKVREKIALYSNVPLERVFSMHHCESVYFVPEMLRQARLDAAVMDILQLQPRVAPEVEAQRRCEWNQYLDKFRSADKQVTIGITGKYTAVRDSYASILLALEHAATHSGARVRVEWIDTTDVDEHNVAERLAGVAGVIVPGGFGMRGVEGKIACVWHVRQHRIPFLGLCYGFQVAVIEFARAECGLEGANSTEVAPNCPHPVIDILPEQKQIEGLGGNMRLGGRDVQVQPGTLASRLLGGAPRVRMRFRHRYEVDPKYIQQLSDKGLIFSGRAPEHPIMQILELPESRHPFFVATQAHAELTSRPLRPDPLFLGFLRAALARASEQQESRTAAQR
jgi:CTP synthase